MLYDLTDQRKRALARTEDAIEDLRIVLRETALDSPSRYLVENLLRTLHKTKARLESGLIDKRTQKARVE